MKILLYTDNHFCSHSSIIRKGGNKYSLRLENQIQSINWAEQLAIDEKCDAIYHLGDFFDKSELNSEELTALKEIKWANLPHTFLCGNHEMSSSNSEFNSLNALSKIGRVVSEPTLKTGYGYKLMLLPYVVESNKKSIKEYINELNSKKPLYIETCEFKRTIILSHNDISGIDYGYYISKQGFKIEDIENNCDLFINGHLHNQNQVSKKIFNLGNLTGQNFGEDAFRYSHCVGILNTDNLQLECIINPYAFNFYKLDINNINDLNHYLYELITPAIVTIKTPLSLMNEVKEILNNNKDVIIESRIIGIPEIKEEWSNNEPIIKIDHIKQFKDYILNELGDSDILREELDNI